MTCKATIRGGGCLNECETNFSTHIRWERDWDLTLHNRGFRGVALGPPTPTTDFRPTKGASWKNDGLREGPKWLALGGVNHTADCTTALSRSLFRGFRGILGA